jgi:hypothetical protein
MIVDIPIDIFDDTIAAYIDTKSFNSLIRCSRWCNSEFYKILYKRRVVTINGLNSYTGSLKYCDCTCVIMSHILYDFSSFSNLRKLAICSNVSTEIVYAFPASLTHLDLHGFNQPLNEGMLPAGLINLYFHTFNQPLNEGVLPASLTYLDLPTFNHPLNADVLPAGLIYLNFYVFNQPLNAGMLPASLKTLVLDEFDQPLNDDVLPASLTRLDIPLLNASVLPARLTYLNFHTT